MSPYVSKGVPESCLDPKNENIENLNIENQIACEGIEPWFYKELYPLQHELLAK